MRLRPPAVAITVLVASWPLLSCAAGLPRPETPGPADIPRLEADLARDSSDLRTRVALGAAYRAAGRPADAVLHLERAIAVSPPDPAAVLFLGLTYEDLGQPGRARDLYLVYLETGRSETHKEQLRQRLELLERQEIVAEARRLVQEEPDAPPEPNTVAIFPFLFTGANPDYQPLSRALAHVLITDLGQTSRIRILERIRTQAILDEIDLARSDLVDPATAVRTGRLLRAERVIQGSINADAGAVQLTATIVGVSEQAEPRVLPEERGEIARLLAAAKRLALAIYRELGIELTNAETQRVLEEPTTNIQALLAFGLGLEAEDRGDFDEAARQFGQAAQLDPSFTMAVQHQSQAATVSTAQATTTEALVQAATDELGPVSSESGAAGPPSAPTLDALASLMPDPIGRDAAAEALGVEGLATRTILRLILRRPF